MTKKICLIGCWDSKGKEYAYLASELQKQGHILVVINVGVFKILSREILGRINIHIEDLVNSESLERIRNKRVRTDAIKYLRQSIPGALKVITDCFDCVIGMAGSTGTPLILDCMEAIKATEKICITTISPQLTSIVNEAGIFMVPSICDIAGVDNPIFRSIIHFISNYLNENIEAVAIADWLKQNLVTQKTLMLLFIINFMQRLNIFIQLKENSDRLVGITMFGNTNQCVDNCAMQLRYFGYIPLVFHATGIGGQVLAYLVQEDYIMGGFLDITMAELSNLIGGGVFDAPLTRFEAALQKNCPTVWCFGCLDMINYYERVKGNRGHIFTTWGNNLPLARTNETETREIAKNLLAIVQRYPAAKLKMLIPQMGLSALGSRGGRFSSFSTDNILWQALKGDERVKIMPCSINDREFAVAAVGFFRTMQKFQDPLPLMLKVSI